MLPSRELSPTSDLTVVDDKNLSADIYAMHATDRDYDTLDSTN